MALCESQLDSALPGLERGESSDPETVTAGDDSADSPQKKHKIEPKEALFGLKQGALPLSVDYRSPVSHFIPPAVEMYAAQKAKPELVSADSSASPTPTKRKRGRPRVDKTSPEYLAKSAARKQAREMATVMNNSGGESTGEKRKRGRPRIDKTSPEYLARKRQRELEALEKKAKRQKRRATGASDLSARIPKHAGTKNHQRPTKRVPSTLKTGLHASKIGLHAAKTGLQATKTGLQATKTGLQATKTGAKMLRKVPRKVVRKVSDKRAQLRRNGKLVRRKDSAASSSGDGTPRVKRKYTKRAPGTGPQPGRPRKTDAGTPTGERVKGKRGRPRKADLIAAGLLQQNNKSLQQAKIRVRSNLMPMNSEPISVDSDDEPDLGSPSRASDSLSLDENLRALRHLHEKYANLDRDDAIGAELLATNYNASEDRSKQEAGQRVEKLEDSSNSDSDSSSSGSGSGSSSSSSSSSSSGSSSSSSDSDSSDDEVTSINAASNSNSLMQDNNDGSFGAWSNSAASPQSESSLSSGPPAAASPQGSVSESDNESPDKSFQCHICRKWYSTLVTLKIHRRGHQSRGGGGGRSRARSTDRYECDCCSAAFTRREKLWEHKASAHRGEMTVRCSVCRKCFEDENELAAHDAAHTPDEREGRCSECGAVFPRHEQLRRHRAAAHGARAHPHTCAQCGKGFGHAHSLTRHLHNHARQLYKCVVCKASFARADQLAQHLNSHLANYKRLKP